MRKPLIALSAGIFACVVAASSQMSPVWADDNSAGLANVVKEAEKSTQDQLGKNNKKVAKSVTHLVVNSSPQAVWETLTDFDHYPQIFSRMKSCAVTKREGDLVYVESHLKPQMFVQQTVQHTINNLSAKPHELTWRMIDGNFASCEGSWKLKSIDSGKRCEVTYTLSVDPGPVIPAYLVSFTLKFVQKDIVNSVKRWTEANKVQASAIQRTSHDNHIRHAKRTTVALNEANP